MKKVLVSILALAMMLSCFCTINVFADEVTPTITAIDANNVTVGTYTSISSAASAAGENGKVVLSAGTFEFNGRQGISVNGITLEGADKNATFIKTSDTFKDGSETNRKALLTIAANNVTVKDLTIDGSVYGSTINPNNDDFVVLRCNSGSDVELNNILVKGSKKSLIQIGTSTTSSTVTGVDLCCEAYYKAIPSILNFGTSKVFADIDITNSSQFTLESGTINGFLNVSSSSARFTNQTNNHYHLEKTTLFMKVVDVTTTTKHFVNSYVNVKDSATSTQLSTFNSTVAENTDIISDMTEEAIDVDDQAVISNFIVLLQDVIQTNPDATLSECLSDLQHALHNN